MVSLIKRRNDENKTNKTNTVEFIYKFFEDFMKATVKVNKKNSFWCGGLFKNENFRWKILLWAICWMNEIKKKNWDVREGDEFDENGSLGEVSKMKIQTEVNHCEIWIWNTSWNKFREMNINVMKNKVVSQSDWCSNFFQIYIDYCSKII